MFVIGGSAVNGGVYGNHPNIAASAIDRRQGNTSLPAGLRTALPLDRLPRRLRHGLKHWLNMSQVQILSSILVPDTLSGEYRSVANGINLDMGFPAPDPARERAVSGARAATARQLARRSGELLRDPAFAATRGAKGHQPDARGRAGARRPRAARRRSAIASRTVG